MSYHSALFPSSPSCTSHSFPVPHFKSLHSPLSLGKAVKEAVASLKSMFSSLSSLLLVFSVTPFKIDQNKNQIPSIDKVQNLENKRRYIYKDPRQDSGQRNISYMRYPKKCFTQTYSQKRFVWRPHAGVHLDEP